MGFRTLVAEITREPAKVEQRSHAEIVERVESVERSGPAPVEATEPFQALQEFLELLDFGLQLPSHAGIKVVSVDVAPILHAVAEPGVEQLDTVLSREENNVVIDRGNAGGYRDIEGNRGPVVLRHVGGHRVTADSFPRLEQSKFEPVRVPVQGPGDAKSGNTRTDDRHPSRHRTCRRCAEEVSADRCGQKASYRARLSAVLVKSPASRPTAYSMSFQVRTVLFPVT